MASQLALTALAAGLMLSCAESGHAGEGMGVRAAEKVAAAAEDRQPNHPRQRAILPGVNAEIERLLAQSAPATGSETGGDTVLVVFASSAPEAAEQDIAKEHKLELVRRLDAGSHDKRIVQYRILDGRNAAEVVAALKADLRVSMAQLNVRYTVPPQAAPPTAVSGLEAPAGSKAKQAKRKVSRADRKLVARAPPPMDSEEPSAKAATPSSQAGRALVANGPAGLRWPTADEPFVNIGMRNR
jgi:hypothetical protein